MDTIRSVVLCQPRETAIAVADSALNKGLLSKSQLLSIEESLPRTRARVLQHTDERAESGLESIVRTRLLDRGHRPQVQVFIPGIGRVDLLLGSVIIELDGREFHESTFERDRQRDAVAATLGLNALRFSYTHVTRQWDLVLHAIESALSR